MGIFMAAIRAHHQLRANLCVATHRRAPVEVLVPAPIGWVYFLILKGYLIWMLLVTVIPKGNCANGFSKYCQALQIHAHNIGQERWNFFFSTNFTHIVFPFEIPVLGLTCSDLYLLQISQSQTQAKPGLKSSGSLKQGLPRWDHCFLYGVWEMQTAATGRKWPPSLSCHFMS